MARTTKKSADERPSPKSLFLQGVEMSQHGFLFDAVEKFREVAAVPRSPFADDALFNVGLCYLKMKLYGEALDTFAEVISRFPRSKIADVGGAKEFGRTAAKAHLGRVHAFLALGDRDAAKTEAALMKPMKDSYVLGPGRRKRSFFALAREALDGA
jgi:tetratricopeptide (TPR) repeat protein